MARVSSQVRSNSDGLIVATWAGYRGDLERSGSRRPTATDHKNETRPSSPMSAATDSTASGSVHSIVCLTAGV